MSTKQTISLISSILSGLTICDNVNQHLEPWPGSPSDLNPIENCWTVVKKTVAINRPSSVHDQAGRLRKWHQSTADIFLTLSPAGSKRFWRIKVFILLIKMIEDNRIVYKFYYIKWQIILIILIVISLKKLECY